MATLVAHSENQMTIRTVNNTGGANNSGQDQPQHQRHQQPQQNQQPHQQPHQPQRAPALVIDQDTISMTRHRLNTLFAGANVLDSVNLQTQLTDLFQPLIPTIQSTPRIPFHALTKANILTYVPLQIGFVVVEALGLFNHPVIIPTLRYLLEVVKVPFVYHEFLAMVHNSTIRHNTAQVPLVIQCQLEDRSEALDYLHRVSHDPLVNTWLADDNYDNNNDTCNTGNNDTGTTTTTPTTIQTTTPYTRSQIPSMLHELDIHRYSSIDKWLRNPGAGITTPRYPILDYLTTLHTTTSTLCLSDLFSNQSPSFLDRAACLDLLIRDHGAAGFITLDTYSNLISNFIVHEDRFKLFRVLFTHNPNTIPSNLLVLFLSHIPITSYHFGLVEWWFRQDVLAQSEPSWSGSKPLLFHTQFASKGDEIASLQRTLQTYAPILSRLTCTTNPIDMVSFWLHQVLIPRVVQLFKLVRVREQQHREDVEREAQAQFAVASPLALSLAPNPTTTTQLHTSDLTLSTTAFSTPLATPMASPVATPSSRALQARDGYLPAIPQQQQQQQQQQLPLSPASPKPSSNQQPVSLLVWLKRFMSTFDATFTGFYTRNPALRAHHVPAIRCSDNHNALSTQNAQNASNNGPPNSRYQIDDTIHIVQSTEMSRESIAKSLIVFDTTLASLLDFLPCRLVFDSATYSVQFPLRTNLPLQLYITVDHFVIPSLFRQLWQVVYQCQRMEAFLKAPTHLIRHQDEENNAQGNIPSFDTFGAKRNRRRGLSGNRNSSRNLILNTSSSSGSPLFNNNGSPSSLRQQSSSSPLLSSATSMASPVMASTTSTTPLQSSTVPLDAESSLGVCLQVYFDQLYQTTLTARPNRDNNNNNNNNQHTLFQSRIHQNYGFLLNSTLIQQLIPLSEMPSHPPGCTCPIPSPEKLQRLLFEYLFPIFPATSVLVQGILSNSPMFQCITTFSETLPGTRCLTAVINRSVTYFQFIVSMLIRFHQSTPLTHSSNNSSANSLPSLSNNTSAASGNCFEMQQQQQQQQQQQNKELMVGYVGASPTTPHLFTLPSSSSSSSSSSLPPLQSLPGIAGLPLGLDGCLPSSLPTTQPPQSVPCSPPPPIQLPLPNPNLIIPGCGGQTLSMTFFSPSQRDVDQIQSKYKSICLYTPIVYNNLIIYTFFLLHRLDLIFNNVDPKTASCPIIPYFSTPLQQLQRLLIQFLELFFRPTYSALGLNTVVVGVDDDNDEWYKNNHADPGFVPLTVGQAIDSVSYLTAFEQISPLPIGNLTCSDSSSSDDDDNDNDDADRWDYDESDLSQGEMSGDEQMLLEQQQQQLQHKKNNNNNSNTSSSSSLHSSPLSSSKSSRLTLAMTKSNRLFNHLEDRDLTRLQRHYRFNSQRTSSSQLFKQQTTTTSSSQTTLLFHILFTTPHTTNDINFWGISSIQGGMYGQSHPECFKALALESVLDAVCLDLLITPSAMKKKVVPLSSPSLVAKTANQSSSSSSSLSSQLMVSLSLTGSQEEEEEEE